MTKKARSAAVALVRGDGERREVLLVHPGGPFWAKREVGAWSLPKGVVEAGEDELSAAKREFQEELGQSPPSGPWVDLGEASQKSGKVVHAFAVRGDLDVSQVHSNEVELEYPTHSGKLIRFPEVDRAVWATLEQAKSLVNPGQLPLIERAMTAAV